MTKEKGGGELKLKVFHHCLVIGDKCPMLVKRRRFLVAIPCSTADVFVQNVKAAPFPMSVMCFEWQLDDMVRFLTCNMEFSVLTFDTTFKLGQFYVTPMTYRHLMLEDIKHHRHPIMLGPLLVHQKVDFPAFNYFGST